MPTSRYENREILVNNNKMYSKKLKDRGISLVRQFGTPAIKKVTSAEWSRIQALPHVWRLGDRYYKLAHQFYGSSQYWWLIAWFNEKPTESHLEIGDPVYIPTPLAEALTLYNDI
jgi:hypothetical protein